MNINGNWGKNAEMMELLKLKLTILEHFLVHRTFQIGHCKLDQLDSRVGVCQLHSSTRRIFGSQFRERILDVQQFDPFRHCIWCLSLGSGKYLRLGWPILKQVLMYLDVFQTVFKRKQTWQTTYLRLFGILHGQHLLASRMFLCIHRSGVLAYI